ncbi:hypothetical protein NYR55_10925 [Sphingomonas sp. BGYR3]|uniref:hypothetical protein n=1 Tax=Sphingomonas sp. BGYR3 TaxID=2975483 RepID=UPI0021A3C433|nr:hypothetical protein [Sphingomonas sp. BGYR3]MDG5489126.1 hypothetical protein [Sphingomonas sp. BGYR3]
MDGDFPAPVIAAAGAAAREYWRTGSGEAALIEGLAASALTLAEQFTGRAWIARAGTAVLAASPAWQRLPLAGMSAITGVEGLPAEGAAFALPVEAYAIDIDAWARGWVRVMQPGGAGRVRVAYTAGVAADWAALPPPIAQGVVLMTGHLHDHRSVGMAPPAAVAALWRPWRMLTLGAGR